MPWRDGSARAGDRRIGWLSRCLNLMAKTLGIPLADYGVEAMTDDARYLSDFWYRDWKADVFSEAFGWVAQHFNTLTTPVVSTRVRELFYNYGLETGRIKARA